MLRSGRGATHKLAQALRALLLQKRTDRRGLGGPNVATRHRTWEATTFVTDARRPPAAGVFLGLFAVFFVGKVAGAATYN